MKTFWLFRTNLKPLEYYHSYHDLETFKQKCHDFYLLQGIWFLENSAFDEVVIWRLKPRPDYQLEIIFNVNGKRFIQRFVNNFNDCFSWAPSPDITFFRGGFPEYAKLTKAHAKHFGLKLYYGAGGKRIYPQYGGVYDKILVEDKRDYGPNTIPFYKTANPNIFYPTNAGPKTYDLSWVFLDTNDGRKGAEWFIKQIAKSDYLKSLKILHVGSSHLEVKKLCVENRVNNIKFIGFIPYHDVNTYLNMAKASIVTSNLDDGSPRIIAEILMSGTPLLIRDETKRTDNLFFRQFNEFNIESNINIMINVDFREPFINLRNDVVDLLGHDKGISIDFICKKNLDLWM